MYKFEGDSTSFLTQPKRKSLNSALSCITKQNMKFFAHHYDCVCRSDGWCRYRKQPSQPPPCNTPGEYSCSLAHSKTFRPSAACLWLHEVLLGVDRPQILIAEVHHYEMFHDKARIVFSAGCECASCCVTTSSGGAFA